MVPAPTQLVLVNLDGLIRTTDLFGAALQEHQHGFPAKHASVCDRLLTQRQFVFDLVGGFAAHDVVHDEQNFEKSKFTLLEP